MKAMQDKIIAIITNMVLSLAIIVVASTMGSDVTGKDEGEQNKLETSYDKEADVNASLLEKDDMFVGVAVESPDSDESTNDANTTVAGTGDLFKDNGRFRNIEISYPCYIVSDFGNQFNGLKEYLCSKLGYAKLEDSYALDHYRLARAVTDSTR